MVAYHTQFFSRLGHRELMNFCLEGILAEALIYAAEAYHTRGAIRHVVGGMQLKSIGGQNNNALSTHDLWVSMISIYTLSDLGDLSNLIGSLSRTI